MSNVAAVTKPSRRTLRRDDESGLTTLEWLLIVAAVAGLAALAVVLVNTVVDDTAEQISGSSARKTAAQVAATELMAEAQRDADQQPSGADTYGEWEIYYTRLCNRLGITYSDVPGLIVESSFNSAHTATNTASSPVEAAEITIADVDATRLGSATAPAAANSSAANAHCRIP